MGENYEQITVVLSQKTTQYPIYVGKDLLPHCNIVHQLGSLGARCVLVVDKAIVSSWGKLVEEQLLQAHIPVHMITLEAKESHKTRQVKEWIEDQLIDKKIGQDTFLIAMGGGIISDIAGFVAATYCRGIPYVIIPTTLLAIVDASIGGKNGINTPGGKNLIGTIYHPKLVIADLQTLNSLPEYEIKMGMVEMFKHALLNSRKAVEKFEADIPLILNKNENRFARIVGESCRIKVNIVEKEQSQPGIRHLLNLGHTIGHALEKLENFTISHGDAVALGILCEAYIAHRLEYLSQTDLVWIRAIIDKINLSLVISKKFTFSQWQEALQMDKKTAQQKARFVLLERIGQPLLKEGNYCHNVSEGLIRESIEWMQEQFVRDQKE